MKCRRGSELILFGPKNRIEVVVRSDRIAYVEEVPYFSGVHHYLGPTAVHRRSKVEYRHQLDEEQQTLVRSAKEIADSQGLELRVHDLSRDGILQKLLRSVFGGRASTPTLATHGIERLQLPVADAFSLGAVSLSSGMKEERTPVQGVKS